MISTGTYEIGVSRPSGVNCSRASNLTLNGSDGVDSKCLRIEVLAQNCFPQLVEQTKLGPNDPFLMVFTPVTVTLLPLISLMGVVDLKFGMFCRLVILARDKIFFVGRTTCIYSP